MANKSNRPYDLVVYGATGYTGEITCEYIAKHAKNKEKWAIAGRSKDKLEKLRADLAKINPSLSSSLDLITCDATKKDEIRSLTSKTKVLINCVGPYRIYGEDVVAACVESDTDYVDVTGEPPFVNDMVDKYHGTAEKKKLFILPACGIGSLIPDVAVEALKEEFQKEKTHATNAKGYLKFEGKYSKTFSNGTWNTFVNSMASTKKRGPRPPAKTTTSTPRKRAPKAGTHIYKPINNWAVPFVEGADLHVVRRTNDLTLSEAGSEDFSYAQFMCIPLIPPLYIIMAVLLVVFAQILSAFSFTRKLLLKRKIADGGPSKEQRADGKFNFWVHGLAESGERKTIHATGPGPYDTTGVCAAEAAFALINDREELKPTYGVVTPGAVMTKQMLRRLPTGGVNFKFE